LPVFNEDRLKQVVLDIWNRHRKRWDVKIEGFAIMPEHIHILIRGSADSVRKFMQYSLGEISEETSKRVNIQSKTGLPEAVKWISIFKKHANGGATYKVWKERFRCVALDKEDAVVVKLNYMHYNPVKRGLVAAPEEWIWSSYSHYHGLGCIIPIDSACCGN
jgi:REP element-mobilizing transposase RayT